MIPNNFATPTDLTSAAILTRTLRLDMESTPASVRRSPAWRLGSPSGIFLSEFKGLSLPAMSHGSRAGAARAWPVAAADPLQAGPASDCLQPEASLIRAGIQHSTVLYLSTRPNMSL